MEEGCKGHLRVSLSAVVNKAHRPGLRRQPSEQWLPSERRLGETNEERCKLQAIAICVATMALVRLNRTLEEFNGEAANSASVDIIPWCSISIRGLSTFNPEPGLGE